MKHWLVEKLKSAELTVQDADEIICMVMQRVREQTGEPNNGTVLGRFKWARFAEARSAIEKLVRVPFVSPSWQNGIELVALPDVLRILGAERPPDVLCKNCGVKIRNATGGAGGDYWLHISPKGMTEYVGCNFVAEPA